MMRRLFIALLLLPVLTVLAQGERCASWTRLQRQFSEIPGYEDQFREMERRRQEALQESGSQRSASGTVITIPVVVHIVYYNEVENISDAQVKSQLSVLNKDFRSLNSDKLPSNHPFYGFIGDAEIEFCLATKDPNNNPTTGIIRKQTTVTNGFTDDDKVKLNSKGGDDAWDRSRYLNIWVCNMRDNFLGYSSFPGDPAALDGVVIDHQCFGTLGTVTPPFNKGRTTTHEVGHWLSLYHTWGDEDACDADDGVLDTPAQEKATFGCPSGYVTDLCASFEPGKMYQNFMDYTDDDCMNMFTIKQAERMRYCLNNERTSILTSNQCGSLSSANPQQDRSIRIYPNPVTNYLYLENLPQSTSDYNIEIFDELGRVVQTAAGPGPFVQVEVSSLVNGYYMVRVYNGERFSAEKVLVLH